MPTDRTLTPLLTTDLDFDTYAESFERGTAPDRFPYGLETLPEGWRLRCATLRFRNRFVALAGRAVRRFSGADVVGALQRWRGIRDADVLYAHCEAEYLGAAFLLKVTRTRRPVLVGHTIWLFGAWESLPRWRRRFLRWVMTRVDLFVYNAEPNCALGSGIFPEGVHEYVPFGVSRMFRDAGPWSGRDSEAPLILSVGDDRSRDWDVFAKALSGLPVAVDVRLATRQTPPRMDLDRAVVRPTAAIAELCDLYRSAYCLVVPSSPNSHAGGITTILEGTAIGIPVVATDTGGLDAYFDGSEIAFVPPADPAALRERILGLLDDPAAARAMADRARARVDAAGYTNDLYWERIVACITEKASPMVRVSHHGSSHARPAPQEEENEMSRGQRAFGSW